MAQTPINTPAKDPSSVEGVLRDKSRPPAPARPKVKGCGSGGNQLGNRNALRHGLTAGQSSKVVKYIDNALAAFRRRLEDHVFELRNAVTVTDAAYIQTCVRWERVARLAIRAQRIGKPEDVLRFSELEAKASERRDKALASLKLDAAPQQMDLATYLEAPTTNKDDSQ